MLVGVDAFVVGPTLLPRVKGDVSAATAGATRRPAGSLAMVRQRVLRLHCLAVDERTARGVDYLAPRGKWYISQRLAQLHSLVVGSGR